MLMKKYLSFACVSAVALAGVCSFTACSSEEEVVTAAVEDNPTYDPVANTVNTQFVMNVAANAKSNNATRSSATTVQNDGANFRGINNVVLFAYKTNGQKFIGATQIATDAAKRYDLGTVLAADAVNNTDKSNRVLELSIPVETDAMLFYGKAIKGSMSDMEAGKVSYTVIGSQADQFQFSLTDRIASYKTRYDQTASLIAFILTRVITVSSTYTVNTTTYPDWTGETTLTTTLAELGRIYKINNDADLTNDERALSPLEEILGRAFNTLTTISENEYRAGSGEAVIKVANDLYAVAQNVESATPTSPYEELAKGLAQVLGVRIANYFPPVSGEITTFNTLSNIRDHIVNAANATGVDASTWTTRFGQVVDGDLNNFPVTTFQLPKGAALLTYNSTDNTFSYQKRKPVIGDAIAEDEATRYQFPAELMYFANSSIRTSNTEKKQANYPNGVSNWDAATWTGDWSSAGSKVTSATRATAMTQNVNYGVAMLESKVGIKTGVGKLKDNNKAFHPAEDNKEIDPFDLDLTLVGVMIGGQPKSVDWQFLPVSGTAYNRIIYDNSIGGNASGIAVPKEAGELSSSNYTIVFDNYNASGTQNSSVRVALEFVNNGDSFWGKENMIKKGTTFYLVGDLILGSNAITNWDAHYQVPPLNASGESQQITRIFTQDYKTTARFRLTETSLQNAYNTIPDLRSSQLSFGLSVDINWRPGLIFDVDLTGNN